MLHVGRNLMQALKISPVIFRCSWNHLWFFVTLEITCDFLLLLKILVLFRFCILNVAKFSIVLLCQTKALMGKLPIQPRWKRSTAELTMAELCCTHIVLLCKGRESAKWLLLGSLFYDAKRGFEMEQSNAFCQLLDGIKKVLESPT